MMMTLVRNDDDDDDDDDNASDNAAAAAADCDIYTAGRKTVVSNFKWIQDIWHTFKFFTLL